MGFEKVRALLVEMDDSIYYFVEEAIKRNIKTPHDLVLLNHEEYVEKWHRFCDEYFENKSK